MIIVILIIQGRITIDNISNQPLSPHIHSHHTPQYLFLLTHCSLTSRDMLVYITCITQLHKLIINRSHSYTNWSSIDHKFTKIVHYSVHAWTI